MADNTTTIINGEYVEELTLNGKKVSVEVANRDDRGHIISKFYLPRAAGQARLIPGENIITINGETLLKPGNLNIYKKDETYSRSETEYLLSKKLEVLRVDILPSTGQRENTIYSTADGSLFMFRAGQWIPFGSNNDVTIPENISHFENDVGYITANDIPFIPTKISDLVNDSDFITEHQSLDDYALKSEIPTVPTRLSSFINDTGYLTQHQSLAAYALRTEIPTIPTKLSSFTDDVGYLTQHQSLAAYALKTEIPNKLSAFTDDVGYLTEHQSLVGLVNESTLSDRINSAVDSIYGDGTQYEEFNTINKIAGYIAAHTDDYSVLTAAINGKASKSQIPTRTSQLTNDSGFLTQHQSLDDYSTKSFVTSTASETLTSAQTYTDNQITSQIHTLLGEGEVAEAFDTFKEIADYLTEHGTEYADLVIAVNNKADSSAVPTKLSDLTNDVGYISGSTLYSYALKSEIPTIPTVISAFTNDSGYITDDHVLFDNANATITATFNFTTGITTGHVLIDTWKIQRDSNYFKLTNGNNDVLLINNTSIIPAENMAQALGNSSHSWTNLYLTGNIVNGGATYSLPSDSGTLALADDIPTKVSDLTNDAGYLTQHQSLSEYATKTYVINQVHSLLGDGEVAQAFDTFKEIADYLTQHGSDYAGLVMTVNQKADSSSIPTKVSDLTNDAGYLTTHQDLTNYATQTYVSTYVGGEISKIAIPSKVSDLTIDMPFVVSDTLQNYVTVTDLQSTISNIAIPTKVSDLTNDTGFITSSALNHYATETYVNDAIAGLTIPDKVSQLTNDSGYVTNSTLTMYALATSVPTKTSDLDNDSHFVTDSRLNDFVTGTTYSAGIAELRGTGEIPTQYNNIKKLVDGVSSLAATPAPTKVSDLTNDSNFVTATEMNQAIANAIDAAINGNY